MYSDNYLTWVREKGVTGLTRTQHEFAEFLLTHHREVGRIGDLKGVFVSVQAFIKHSPHFRKPEEDTP